MIRPAFRRTARRLFPARLFAAALTLTLAACARTEPPAPRPLTGAHLVPAPVPAPQGENQALTAPPLMLALSAEPDGPALPVAYWPAEGETRAVLVGLHGYGDYGSSTFARAARRWAQMGIAVYAPDQRGFGRAPGFQTWPGAAVMTGDAAALLDAVRETAPGTPVFLAGHSMGGAVALATVGHGAPVDGLILLAPAVWGGAFLNPALRVSAWSAAQIAPEKRWTGEGVVSIQPTDDIPMLIALSRDPLHYAAPSGREFLGLIRLMDDALSVAPQAAAPTLVILGRHEEVVSPAAVEALPGILPGPVDFAYAPEGWHMLLRDKAAPAVWESVGTWILGHLPAPPRKGAVLP